jgi:glutamyl-Q tRNA(Asp) synthetase
MQSLSYCGRFAPSPTGPLHFGSLVAALGSCLEARQRAGRWCLRIEDLDLPRCPPGAADDILRSLEAHGFGWDGEVMYQSRRNAAYQAVLEGLSKVGHVFACACTRSELADSSIARTADDGALIYPGTCRHGLPPGRSARAWRLRVGTARAGFVDAVQGPIEQALAEQAGDFILQRADGLFAYQLAVVVDDAEQGVNHVVRGADLLDSTPRQILLQQRLGLPVPAYCHLPVAVNAAGEKLSKQTRAAPLRAAEAVANLWAALDFLGQQPPAELRAARLDEIWQWSVANWCLAHVPHRRTLSILEESSP